MTEQDHRGGSGRGTVVGLNAGGGGLSNENFNVPANDEQGHGVRMWMRVPPSLAQQANNIVSSRNFPYRNVGELIRHALVRHMRWLNAISPVPMSSLMAQTEAIIEVCTRDEFNARFAEVMRRVTEMINRYVVEGEVAEARKLLLSIERKIKGIPETYWRKRYLKELWRQHGDILKNMPKASLSPSKATDEDEDDEYDD